MLVEAESLSVSIFCASEEEVNARCMDLVGLRSSIFVSCF